MVTVLLPKVTFACAGGLGSGLLSFCAKAEELMIVANKVQQSVFVNVLRCIGNSPFFLPEVASPSNREDARVSKPRVAAAGIVS
jgi:hypothetical protein